MWEVVSYGGGEFLRLVINGVAALTATNDYVGALRVVALIALLWVLIEAAFGAQRPNYGWLFAMVMVYLTLLVPRTEVIITDRIDPTNNAVVSNVPLGMAVFTSFASKIGDWLTRSFETAFTLPDDLRYSNSGALFAHHLVQSSTRFRINDARLAENMSQFWRQCVFYDLFLGLYTLDDLRDSDDLQTFLAANTSVSRRFTYNTASGERNLFICRTGWGVTLRRDLATELMVAQRYFGRRLVRASTADDAIARFSTALPVAYQFITGISRNSEQIITQQVLAHAAERGLIDFAVSANATAAAQSFTLARAQRERRISFVALGELAARTLPLLRGVIEGMLYGLFPVVGLMLMLPVAAQVWLSYTKALIWIQLWPPLYALLNLAATLYSQLPGEAALTLPDGRVALTLANVSALGDAMAEMSAMAGYLSLSIPLISYLILNSTGAVAASIASGIVQSYESPVSRAAEEVSTGNIALGNSQVGNATWWQSQSAPTARSDYVQSTGASGATHTTSAGGAQTVSIPTSSTPVQVDLRQAVAESASQRASSELNTASSSVNEWNTNSSAALGAVQRVGQSLRQDSSSQSTLRSGESDRLAKDVATVEKVLDTLGKEYGLSNTEALGAAAGVNAGSSIGKFFGISANGQGRVEARDSESYREAVNYASESGVRTSLDNVLEYATSQQASHSLGYGEDAAAQASLSSSQLATVGERAQTSLGKAHAWQEVQQQVEQTQIGAGENLSARLYHSLSAEYGTDKADRILQVHQGAVASASQAERGQADQAISKATDQLVNSLVGEHLGGIPGGEQVQQQATQWQQQVREEGSAVLHTAQQQPELPQVPPLPSNGTDTTAAQQQVQQTEQQIEAVRQEDISPERGQAIHRNVENQQRHLEKEYQEENDEPKVKRLLP
ncbi:MAG: conjugal transfer protein TraG N-terminal domain-containing protein [Candidatus Porifericomitaceae bacterium WSBS_2022_MAG_OTU9]